jgi:hypothetical protein
MEEYIKRDTRSDSIGSKYNHIPGSWGPVDGNGNSWCVTRPADIIVDCEGIWHRHTTSADLTVNYNGPFAEFTTVSTREESFYRRVSASS